MTQHDDDRAKALAYYETVWKHDPHTNFRTVDPALAATFCKDYAAVIRATLQPAAPDHPAMTRRHWTVTTILNGMVSNEFYNAMGAEEVVKLAFTFADMLDGKGTP